MVIRFEYDGHSFEISTIHADSRAGKPVLLIDGELTDLDVDLDSV